MLKRLYVHNYKCLVNFEINFDQDISLFLGANGSGKSTVFEVLAKLRRVIVGEEKIENVFVYHDDIPRWIGFVDEKIAHFEIDIEISNSIYKYLLDIGLVDSYFEYSIKEEYLFKDNELLIKSNNKETILIKNEIPYSFDSSRSSVGRHKFILPSEFFYCLHTLFIVRINPYQMVSTISKAYIEVKTDFSNFAEWFAHLNEKFRREVSVFENAIRDVLPRFDIFHIEQAGQVKILQVDFQDSSDKKKIVTYYFNELSDGQKILIALYALVLCAPENSIICIDEPENFLALPEIQPWLNELRDQCKQRNLQALLISHHPSLINFLASDAGYWFSRQDNHTRIEKITEQANDGGLSLAQLIEMGWVYGD